jgi:Skp family chaperone for outer membrane proteins
MKLRRSLFLFFFIFFAAFCVSAQTVAPATPAKVAIFNSDMLTDEKAGVKKIVAIFQQIDTEFKSRRDQIVALKAKYDAAVGIVQHPPAGMDPKAIAAKADEAEDLKSQIEQAQQRGQRDLDKRTKELTDSVFADLATSVQAYAKARGIDVLLDVAKLSGAIMVINNAGDITPAFIADYNAKNAGVPVKP